MSVARAWDAGQRRPRVYSAVLMSTAPSSCLQRRPRVNRAVLAMPSSQRCIHSTVLLSTAPSSCLQRHPHIYSAVLVYAVPSSCLQRRPCVYSAILVSTAPSSQRPVCNAALAVLCNVIFTTPSSPSLQRSVHGAILSGFRCSILVSGVSCPAIFALYTCRTVRTQDL